MSPTRIALDAMGGDHAPRAVLEGALLAVRGGHEKAPVPAERILLVGDEAVIRRSLAELGGDPGFAVLHAAQAIGMDESPAVALRAKPDSSIAKGIGAIVKQAAGSFVSMGNTGAVVGAATLGLGTLRGVKRPAIAVTLDLTGKPLTLLDMGANIAPKPEHLVQSAVMACAYSRACLGHSRPRVGLLNVGEEDSKGTDVLKAAHGLLRQSGLAFVGNVEGGDMFQDKADVVVTDGFTGNVVLKLLEHFSGFMLQLVLGELERQQVTWGPKALARVQRAIDYSEYGGALLLGVNGIVVIGHGRSDARAVANALGLARDALDRRVNADIVSAVEGLATATPEA